MLLTPPPSQYAANKVGDLLSLPLMMIYYCFPNQILSQRSEHISGISKPESFILRERLILWGALAQGDRILF